MFTIVLTIELICLDFEHIYKELDIKITDRGESFYQSRMIEVVQELEGKSMNTKKRRIFMRSKSCGQFRSVEVRGRS